LPIAVEDIVLRRVRLQVRHYFRKGEVLGLVSGDVLLLPDAIEVLLAEYLQLTSFE